jgi:tetratricopeptide (TPR) repeat protein
MLFRLRTTATNLVPRAGRIALRASLLLLCAAAAPATSPTRATDSDPKKLVELLGSTNPLQRNQAAQALLALGHAARPALLHAYENDDPQVRLSAAQLILKLPFDQPGDPPAVAGFLKQYGRPTPTSRITYLRSVVSAAGPAAPRILLRLVREEPNDEVRWAIVAILIRSLDRAKLSPPPQPTGYNAHSPNLALAAWLWEPHDDATAMRLYHRWLDVEDAAPTTDDGAALYAFKALGNAALRARDFDTVAHALRTQARRVPTMEGADRLARATRFDELFALHAAFGPLPGFEQDLASAGPVDLARPQRLYALGRLYQRRGGQNLLADALFRAAYASGAGSPTAREDTGEFLINHAWYDLAETEVAASIAMTPHARTIGAANAHLRMGLLLARRGQDFAAAQHQEQALQALSNLGGTLTRVRDNRTYSNDEVRDQLRAEIHWHYFRAGRAAKDQLEMTRQTAALLSLHPEDKNIVLDVVPTLLESGRRADAAALFTRPYNALRATLDQDPTDTERMNNLAWFCARCDQKLDLALALVSTCLKESPDNSAYLDTAAEVHFQLGHVQQAIDLEKRAIQFRPDTPFLKSQLKRFESKQHSSPNP